MQLTLPTKSIKIPQIKTNKGQHLGIKITDSTHLTQWRQIKTPSSQINCRFHHSSVLCQGNIYVYGGYDNNNGILSDFKMFSNDTTSKWINLPITNGPGPRHSHSSILFQGIIYIFGGKTDRLNNTNKLHAFQLQTQQWSQILTTTSNQHINQIPNPTDSHQAILYNNQMIIYGGFSNNQFTNNIYSLNLVTKKWKMLYSSLSINNSSYQPQPRSDFSMVLYNDKLYIYAGKNLWSSFNDLWQYDFITRKFTKILTKNPPKQNRSGHTAVVYKQFMIIFGGITSVTHQRDDLLSYNFQTKQWKTIWQNSEPKLDITQQQKKRTPNKRLSNIRNSLQNALYDKQYNKHQKQKIKKYRRPLAQQNFNNIKIHINVLQTKHNKQIKQRKIMLINNIQSSVHQNQHNVQPQKYSPLIQSLTNSIMLTSNIHNSNGFNRQSGNYKQYTDKQKKLKARDGHTAHLLSNQMLIFGGDRHMIGINDVTFLNLQLLLNKKYQQLDTSSHKQDKQSYKISDHQNVRFSKHRQNLYPND